MLLVPSLSGLFKWRQFEPEVRPDSERATQGDAGDNRRYRRTA
jgi:hypothetical protein